MNSAIKHSPILFVSIYDFSFFSPADCFVWAAYLHFDHRPASADEMRIDSADVAVPEIESDEAGSAGAAALVQEPVAVVPAAAAPVGQGIQSDVKVLFGPFSYKKKDERKRANRGCRPGPGAGRPGSHRAPGSAGAPPGTCPCPPPSSSPWGRTSPPPG